MALWPDEVLSCVINLCVFGEKRQDQRRQGRESDDFFLRVCVCVCAGAQYYMYRCPRGL